jgi:pseudaminic acid biosynthesis-associated methylase
MTDKALSHWQGSFGEEYAVRNPVTSEISKEAAEVFGRILTGSNVQQEVMSILEVGANVGINLHGLQEIFGQRIELAALEPNPKACAGLRADSRLQLSDVLEGDASRIPVQDGAYDLVFTSGVLIHIPPGELPKALHEIVRVSRRYILCVEYFSHVPVEVAYRSRSGMLWKRDFGRAYLETCPQLETVQYGFIWQQEFPHFDNLNWWMFRKRPQ